MAVRHTTYDFTNYPAGGPAAATYLADADEFNQNFQDVCDAQGAVRIRGTKCTDKASNATTCSIWLANDGGEKDVAESGDYAYIHYNNGGTHTYWRVAVQVSSSDCYISFADADMYEPTSAISVIADYSAAAFIDALSILIIPGAFYWKWPVDNLALTDGATGALEIDNIYNPTTGNPLSTDVDDLKTRVDVALDGSGNLNAGIVDSTSLDGDEVNLTDNTVNMLKFADKIGQDDTHLFGCDSYSTPPATTVDVETTITNGWDYSQKGDCTGSNQGYLFRVAPHWEGSNNPLAGQTVAVSFMVRSSIANAVSIGIYDDSGGLSVAVPAQTVSANTWTRVSVSDTFDASGTTYYAAIVANQATTFYVNEAQMNVGSTSAAYSPAPYSDTARIMMETDNDNYLYNGGFENWTLSTQPDGWALVGAATVAQSSALGTSPDGASYASLTLNQDQGIRQYLGVVTGGGLAANMLNNEKRIVYMLAGKTVCFAVDIYTSAATDPIQIKVYDRDNAGNTNTSTKDIYPDSSWARYYITHDVQADATQIYVEIANRTVASAAQVYYVDSAMINIGQFPMQYKASTGWREERWDFGETGEAVDGEYMETHGVGGGATQAQYPIPATAHNYVMARIAARCLLGPAVSGVYTLDIDGDGTLAVTFGAGATTADNHITTYTTATYECGTYLGAPAYTAGGGIPEVTDTIVSVWGYYYVR